MAIQIVIIHDVNRSSTQQISDTIVTVFPIEAMRLKVLAFLLVTLVQPLSKRAGGNMEGNYSLEDKLVRLFWATFIFTVSRWYIEW